MRRQKKNGVNKRKGKNPEKVVNKMEKSNLSDTKFKTLVLRMLRGISEDFNGIKMIQSETKETVI